MWIQVLWIQNLWIQILWIQNLWIQMGCASLVSHVSLASPLYVAPKDLRSCFLKLEFFSVFLYNCFLYLYL